MADDMNRSERTVKNALNELENAGLLLRVRQSWNRANRLFLQVPDEVQVSSRPAGNTCPIEVQDFSSCMGQDLPPNKNNKKKKDRSENKERESLRRFGEFQNVFLSEGELASLQSDFPNCYVEYIDRLSVYMASNGRRYANHYATSRKWLNEDIRSRDTKTYTAEDYSEGECL